ncbi:aspartate--tRNA ligase [Candidatus Pacearchaeota archaeon CG10_big_fil_rev_8_21_14_0_10_34_76]|nr:MAG: aspartate--tRNA ligase [Candidatus Pacearchaeota archaeon CG10_big_fil_rev_8_21_14_0_10_34_76]
MLRTHTCGELRRSNVGKKVKLSGWVDSIRNFGRLWFIDLRDRYGKTQIVMTEKDIDKKLLKELSLESSVGVEGQVNERKDKNSKIETGDIEVFASSLQIYTKCPTLPFDMKAESSEDMRLKYRYLDLRGEKMQGNMILRHKVYKAIHDFMDKEGFVNIETPVLAKSTPEGARDYIVPSRVNKGKFYALPQSPQIFKQLCMVGGLDKYYQIARCFRDEDLRADRQPEFTQLDIEMSFVDVEDMISYMERLWSFVFKEVLEIELKTPFSRMTYDEAMKNYGRDNPDTRKKGERFALTWVLNFPMFEWKEEDKRWYAMHHPFTSPEDNANFKDLGKIKAKAYDLVLNGSEIGGGSIRIHNKDIQNEVFSALGIKEKEAKEKFGFLLDALSYGAPPHGGIAFGLDRVLQLITESESIRDVIAFPKNKNAADLMMDAPSFVSDDQLKEVGLKLEKK